MSYNAAALLQKAIYYTARQINDIVTIFGFGREVREVELFAQRQVDRFKLDIKTGEDYLDIRLVRMW